MARNTKSFVGGEYLIAHCPYYNVECSTRVEAYSVDELQNALNEFVSGNGLESEDQDAILVFLLNEDVTVIKEGFKVSFNGC
jgi:hypothetical protein